MNWNNFHFYFVPHQELVFMSALPLIALWLWANNFWPWFCLQNELSELKKLQSLLTLKISTILNERENSILTTIAIKTIKITIILQNKFIYKLQKQTFQSPVGQRETQINTPQCNVDYKIAVAMTGSHWQWRRREEKKRWIQTKEIHDCFLEDMRIGWGPVMKSFEYCGLGFKFHPPP